MTITLTAKKIYKIYRVDKAVNEYFEKHPTVNEIAAKKLMPFFIQKGIFVTDHHNGAPIHVLLRELTKEPKLRLLKSKVVQKEICRGWYFIRR